MYSISFVETEPQLKQVLDFCYGILGQHLRDISPYRYEDWKERIERDSKLLVYAHEDGNVISAVLGRRENEKAWYAALWPAKSGTDGRGSPGD